MWTWEGQLLTDELLEKLSFKTFSPRLSFETKNIARQNTRLQCNYIFSTQNKIKHFWKASLGLKNEDILLCETFQPTSTLSIWRKEEPLQSCHVLSKPSLGSIWWRHEPQQPTLAYVHDKRCLATRFSDEEGLFAWNHFSVCIVKALFLCTIVLW